jgi:hypothetical protein
VEGADKIWIGLIGPGIPDRGARTNAASVTQGQVAATIAALLGQDFTAAYPAAAPTLFDALEH